ncbi:chaperonin 10-like protein [Pestalotiopsis sp. NC0098]|nr:chaperonin 10-like protein [Pestalotiopsis sp. NC0098]
MSSSNPTGVVLFANKDGTSQVLRNVAKPEPAGGEVLVKVHYSGVNPADIAHIRLGINSNVIGYDFMGEVVEAGPGSQFAVGDAVAGYTPTGIGRPMKYGSHQPYLAAPEDLILRVPKTLPHDHAAALPVIVTVAADTLYNIFGFPFPGEKPSPDFQPGPLLIWGGSTSAGIAMIQLARASGAKNILVTASPRRHDLLKSLGATECFDYTDPDVVSKIKAAAEKSGDGPVLYAVDSTGASGVGEMVSAASSDKAKLASLRQQRDPRFKMPFSLKARDTDLEIAGIGRITLPAQPEQQAQLWRGLLWAVDNYGSGFSMPSVTVFEGTAEEALEKVKLMAEVGNFGKIVLKHPLK